MAGIIPAFIHYGLAIAPVLLVCGSVCAVLSLATGSSWGTTNRGHRVGWHWPALGLSEGQAAEPSERVYWDKMSPLSDTTNLALAVAGRT